MYSYITIIISLVYSYYIESLEENIMIRNPNLGFTTTPKEEEIDDQTTDCKPTCDEDPSRASVIPASTSKKEVTEGEAGGGGGEREGRRGEVGDDNPAKVKHRNTVKHILDSIENIDKSVGKDIKSVSTPTTTVAEEQIVTLANDNKKSFAIDNTSVARHAIESNPATPRAKWDEATTLRFEQIEIAMKTGQSFKQIIGRYI